MNRLSKKVGKIVKLSAMATVIAAGVVFSSGGHASAVKCDPNELKEMRNNTLLGIPVWYKYLEGEQVEQKVPTKTGFDTVTVCHPTIETKGENLPINDILLIIAAIMEMLTRIAGLAAFVFLIYGGFMYLTSSGNSENVGKAGTTLLNAAIGLGIAISATAFINFFAGRLAK